MIISLKQKQMTYFSTTNQYFPNTNGSLIQMIISLIKIFTSLIQMIISLIQMIVSSIQISLYCKAYKTEAQQTWMLWFKLSRETFSSGIVSIWYKFHNHYKPWWIVNQWINLFSAISLKYWTIWSFTISNQHIILDINKWSIMEIKITGKWNNKTILSNNYNRSRVSFTNQEDLVLHIFEMLLFHSYRRIKL